MAAFDQNNASFCAERLKALSEPHRLRIADALRGGEMAVGDIAESLDEGIVTISHHLKIMKHAGLVDVRAEGRFKYYSLDPNLLCSVSKGSFTFNLGCCRLEVPLVDPPRRRG